MTASSNLVLSRGTIVDPASGRVETGDVVVADGRVQALGAGAATAASSGAETVDCSGAYVVPGLVDAHSHIFHHVSKVGAPVDEAHLSRGVVAVCDAGTAGASTFPAFRDLVVEPSRTRVLSMLNVSVLGLIDFRFGELLNPLTLVAEDAVKTAKENPDVVRGLKIRMSTDVVGEDPEVSLALLEAAIAVGEEAALPLMVHIGETPVSLDVILGRLRPGDIVAHCYTGKEENILDEHGGVRRSVLEARSRGVLFESAHGRSNFSYRIAGPAIEQGFLPDLVCSDTSYRNWNGPVFDLVTTMSKLVALGMTFEQVLARTTAAPARLLGLADEGYGRLDVGGPAHVTVLRQLDASEELPDAAGGSFPVRRFEPELTLVGGERVTPVPWRGRVSSLT
jgi:dihydroorotase